MTAPLALLAAGGTGGHVFPAQALAETLLDRGLRVALATDTRGAGFEVPGHNFETYKVRAGTPSARGVLGKMKALVDLGLGTIGARALLRKTNPAAVVGFGGYPSIPTVLAASFAGCPIVLHEQNAVLGRANRLLASKAERIATCFNGIERIAENDARKTVCTGNPVRPAILATRNSEYQAPSPDGELRLLITGGSQGATVFSNILPDAVALVAEKGQARLRIVQQCRAEDIEEVKSKYEALGVQAECHTFISDMPERLNWAHLAICRSGASTVAELTVAGLPAILVPYPHAMDDHQTANAHRVSDTGGAWTMTQPGFTAETLAAKLCNFLRHPSELSDAANASRAAGMPDAVGKLADLVSETMGVRS